MMDSTQQAQDDQYCIPYHWMLDPLTYRGIDYWTYNRLIKDILSKSNIQTVLDVGCGDGRFVSYLREQLKDRAFTGIDYSEKAIALAKAIGPKEIDFICADAVDYHEKTQKQYDAVTFIATLEHIHPDFQEATIQRITELVKTRGIFIMLVPAIHLPLIKKHYKHFTAVETKALLTKHRFEIVQFVSLIKQRSLWRWLMRIIQNRFYDLTFLRMLAYKYLYPKTIEKAQEDNARYYIAVGKKNF